MFDPAKNEMFYAQRTYQHILERDVHDEEVLMEGDKVHYLTATQTGGFSVYTLYGCLFNFQGWYSNVEEAAEEWHRIVKRDACRS